MEGNKKIFYLVFIVGLMIITVIALGFLYKGWSNRVDETGKEIAPPAATGKLSDLTDALDKEIKDEMNVYYEEDDINLIISDAAEIDKFGQAADDTEL